MNLFMKNVSFHHGYFYFLLSSSMSLVFSHQWNAEQTSTLPREKLWQNGSSALQWWELLAILLKTGTREEDVFTLSQRLTHDAGTKGLFAQNDPNAIKEYFGTYKNHAETIAVVSEIIKRLGQHFDEFAADTVQKIVAHFSDLQNAKQEQVHVLHLDRQHKAIFREVVAMGGKNTVSVMKAQIAPDARNERELSEERGNNYPVRAL